MTRTRTRTAASVIATLLVLALASVLPHDRQRSKSGEGIVSRLDAAEPVEPETRMSEHLSLAAEPDGRAEALDALRRGLERAGADDAAGARAEFERAAARFPGIADWAAMLAVEAVARGGDTASVRELLDAAEPELAREWGWRGLSRARLEAGDLAGATEAALAAAAHLPTGALRAEAWTRAARLRLMSRDSAGAREALLAALEADPRSQPALNAARLLSELPDPSPVEQLAVARLYLRHGNLDRGLAGADAFLGAGRGTAAERAELGLAAGRALFRAGRHADAERRLLAVAEDTGAPRAPASEALLLAGRAQFRDGRQSAASETFRRVADRFPSEPAAAHALFIIADLAHDDGQVETARELYRRAVAASPRTEHAAESAVRLGALAMVAGDHDQAIRLFEALRAANDGAPTRQRAAYWSGRAHLGAGQDSVGRARLEEVLRLDPASWYGLRSADLLGMASWRESLRASPVTDAATVREVTGALARLDLLEQLGRPETSSFEVERVRRHFARRGSGLYALAEALHDRGETFRAVSIGREIQRNEDGWNDRLLRIIYPFPYRETILAESLERGIDAYLVAGLIRQESLFDPAARSPVGAIGLMQLMPRTGRALAQRARAGTVSDALLHQPELNLRLGILHVADLLGHYGRPVDMLAAYNAGSGRLARWRGLDEHGDVDLFVERIPYQETRDYVKVVQQNARIYRALYGDE